MKLNKEEEKILIDWDYSQEDVQQIKSLCYKFTLCHKNGKEEKISIERANEKLSKEQFLSGIGRATFHRTSYRKIKSTQYVGIFIERRF